MIKRTEGKFRHAFGRMIKGISAFLLEQDQLSDALNMQPGWQWKQRKGQTELTTVDVATNLEFKSLFQFRQLNLGGDYILAHTYDAVNGERIMRANELPPDTSPTTWTEEYQLTAGCEVTQFAQVQDAVVIANDKDFLIWRGEEAKPTGVYFYSDTNSEFINWFDETTDGDTSTEMPLNSMTTSDEIYIVSDQPLDTISFLLNNLNSNVSTMTVNKWNGAWVALAITDGTETGGNTTLGQSGDVTWVLATDEITTQVQGLPGYAYQITVSAALDASVSVTGITVHTPWNEVKNIWDGIPIGCQGCYTFINGEWLDYVAQVNSTSTVEAAALGGMDASDFFYVAFSEPCNYILLSVVNDESNIANAEISAINYAKNDGTWASVGAYTDTTWNGVVSTLTKSGSWSWEGPTDEKPRTISGDLTPLFWYQIVFDAALTDPTNIYYIEGIPLGKDPDYSFGVSAWKRRAWQVAPKDRANALRYSSASLPNTWWGSDSGFIEFGERPMRRALPFFNELVIWADSEMWMLQGDAPASFGRMRLSATIGIDAPLSAVSIETGVKDSQGRYKVTLAWFFQGIWMFDGIKWWLISAPDVDTFFDYDHPDCINPDYAHRSYGAYDPETQCAHWIIWSGLTQTTPNKVIVLHVPTMYYSIYEFGTPISSILSAFNKRFYFVAGGHDSGKYYRLNDGDQDVLADGTAEAIDAHFITADMWAEYSTGVQQRAFSLVVESQDEGIVELYEYPDGSETQQPVGSKRQTELGKANADVQWRLKTWPGQQTARFKIRHRSLNSPFVPYGYSTSFDRERSDI